MSRSASVAEVKAHFSDWVRAAEAGEAVVITRHGKPVVELVRAVPKLTAEQIAARRQAFRAIRKRANELRVNLTPEEIKESINEGRR